jgi:ATP-dependent Clp protease ATP-binding subunit ClpC
MFERFTDRARRVVVLAQEEARLLNHGHIGTEHLLLGLIREEQGVAARALTAMDIELQAVRDRVREITGEHSGAAHEGHIPFTPRTKRVLELSLREAIQLGHDHIGTEHILLGLVREGEGVAALILVELGADLNEVRQRVLGLLHVPGTQAGPGGGREPAEVTIARRAASGRMEHTLAASLRARLREIEARLNAVEGEVGRLSGLLRQQGIEPESGEHGGTA